MTENDVLQRGKPAYKRVLLKLSGEALMGSSPFGISLDAIENIAEEIVEGHELGVEIALVIGGGNIFRGVSIASKGMERASADYMGMLATVINALALQDAIEKKGLATRVLSAITMREVAEPYIRRRALRHLEKGRLVIFAAGTGNPYFSTDTAAALRAMEIGAEILLKATKVDGVYDGDPMKDKNARKFEKVTYSTILERHLGVMDSTAISLARDNRLPIVVFNLFQKRNIRKVLCGEQIGTRVEGD